MGYLWRSISKVLFERHGHDLHRTRRAILNPYFSKRAIVELKAVIHERLESFIASTGTSSEQPLAPVNLASVFSTFTADVTTNYFYGSSPDHLGSREITFSLKGALTALLDYYHLTRFLSVPATVLKNLPLPVLRLLHPHFPLVLAARKHNMSRILRSITVGNEIKEDQLESSHPDSGSGANKLRFVIVSALADQEVPAADKTIDKPICGETVN